MVSLGVVRPSLAALSPGTEPRERSRHSPAQNSSSGPRLLIRVQRTGDISATEALLFPESRAGYRREQHALMNGPQRRARTAPAIKLARLVFAGAVIGGTAVGFAPDAYASPCDPLTMSMTPQPVLSCPAPNAVSPPDAPPPDGASVAMMPVPVPAPANAGGPAPANALPPPGQAPGVPPVVDENGNPASYGSQGSYFKEIWHEFHNGVPSDLLFAPAPAPDPAAPPPPPGAPVIPPP